MKKLLLFLLIPFICACGTAFLGYDMTFEKAKIDSESYQVINDTFQNDNVRISLKYTKQEFSIVVENKTSHRISMIWDESALILPDGFIDKLIPDGTKFINAEKTVLPTVIPPNSKVLKMFCTNKQVNYQSFGYYGAKGWVVYNLFPYKPHKKQDLLNHYSFLTKDYLKIYLPFKQDNGSDFTVTLMLKIDNLKAI